VSTIDQKRYRSQDASFSEAGKPGAVRVGGKRRVFVAKGNDKRETGSEREEGVGGR